jgi:hypothetical protein
MVIRMYFLSLLSLMEKTFFIIFIFELIVFLCNRFDPVRTSYLSRGGNFPATTNGRSICAFPSFSSQPTRTISKTKKIKKKVSKIFTPKNPFNQKKFGPWMKIFDEEIKKKSNYALHPLPSPITSFLINLLTKNSRIIGEES